MVLLGEGEVLGGDGRADEALAAAGLKPFRFAPKEGISFINGTQAQTALLTLLVHDAEVLWRTAIGAAAMSLEALRGTPTPLDPRIHAARPHPGQLRAAELMRDLLADSEIRESHRENDPRVQDAYSLRCTPQVMGAVADAIRFARETVRIELNASTDNPLVFDGRIGALRREFSWPASRPGARFSRDRAHHAPGDLRAPGRTSGESRSIPGTARVPDPGSRLSSGFMMVQITAASLVAESRSLSHPASPGSIPTDANQEDFVPMGMAAAFKASRILANAQRVVAAELLCAAQGLEFLAPLRPGRGVERLYQRVRNPEDGVPCSKPTARRRRIWSDWPPS